MSAPMTTFRKIREMQRLLDEALEHALRYDGHSKSSENAISLHFGNYWQRLEAETDTYGDTPTVEIFSYVVGPGRHHYFRNVDEALLAVRGWHAAEMSNDHEGSIW